MAMRGEVDETAVKRLNGFKIDGEPILCVKFGKGHINNTFLVVDDTARMYILQRINSNVFRNPLGVMQNIVAITTYLSSLDRRKRNMLELTPSHSGELWHIDGEGDYWRLYSFISDSICYQRAESEDMFRESGAAFGAFQRSLTDFPAESLTETIPGFHDTPKRYITFHDAINADSVERVKNVQREIEFVLEREERAGTLMKRYVEGVLPRRVTHNDTKLNNVLFDRRSKRSICVIDLDTVMPGFSVTDFGDSIRFGASTADEDEKDLSKVSFSIKLFRAYAEGYLSACGEYLTDGEIDSLCDGAHIITLECGMRFLTDYISGDTYYRIDYPDHNLDRCRTQFKLVADMESKWDAMRKIVEES